MRMLEVGLDWIDQTRGYQRRNRQLSPALDNNDCVVINSLTTQTAVTHTYTQSQAETELLQREGRRQPSYYLGPQFPRGLQKHWLIRRAIMNRNSVKYNWVCRTLWWRKSIGTNVNCAECWALRMCNVLILYSRDHGLLSWTISPLPPQQPLETAVLLPCAQILRYEHHSKCMPLYESDSVIYLENKGVLAGDAVTPYSLVNLLSQKAVILIVTAVRT